MRRRVLFLTTILMVLGMSAQTTSKKVKTVQLKTGTEFYYSEDIQDSIRIIFTPSGDTLGIKIYIRDCKPIDFLYSQIHHVEFWGNHFEIIPDDANENKNNANDLKKHAEAWRLEFPRLHQGDELTYDITHVTAEFGVTYSLEWDANMRANRWTCYQLHSGNMRKNVSRKNNFTKDPKIPVKYNVSPREYSGTGYSRGHLCPSADRLASREQNSQTFYMTNMHPQVQEHNGGVWNSLEGKVRNKWAPKNQEDTLYVVKAATIDPDNIKGYTNTGLIIPNYFYMALLYYSKSSNNYTAIGLWSPHYGGSITEYITIDELERRTGIDFFCNLPDEIEKVVEAKTDMNKWH